MKLYTEEQVRNLSEKMCLATEKNNLGVAANFRHRAIEINKLINSQTPIELPSDEEVLIEAKGYENYNKFMNELESIQSSSRFHGFMTGAKWMRDKIQGDKK